ncbi:hypothetical protein NQZ79_g6725 [Umbelopsis isabellina]|nr:hypothetical protein NQZ79_g6725 [Umbelopsis isabellina]
MLGPEAALRDALNQTTADCNNISAMLSDTESTALLNETSHFVTLFQSTAQNLIDKEPVFASIPLGNIFGSIFIPVIKARFISLDACLLSHIPSNMSATMQNYFNQLDSTCADVCTAFNVSCQLPSYEQ